MITEVMGLLIIVGALIAWFFRQTLKSRKDDPAAVADASAKLCQQLEDAGDQIIGRVETYVTRLEQLTEKADEKIAVLDKKIKELEQLEANSPGRQSAAKGPARPAGPPATAFADVLTKASLQAEQGSQMRQAAGLMPGTDQAADIPGYESAEECREEKDPKKTVSPRNKKVFDLLEQGCSPDEISRQTGLGKGAIGLIKEVYKAGKGQ